MPEPDLQFQKAEFVSAEPELRCASCQSKISDCYFHVAGAVTCPVCAQHRQMLQGHSQGQPSFLRAALYGLRAAVAGSIVYALVSLTGFQFSIVAIVVGVMVGKAIRHVTQGKSSLRYQVLAVVLTYGAITTSFVPLMIRDAAQSRKARLAKNTPADASKPPIAKKPVTAGGFLFAIVFLIGIGLAAPFLILLSHPASGVLNLFIIGIGLMQAWRITRPDQALIMGPYSVPERNAG